MSIQTPEKYPLTGRFIFRVVIKATILFILFNVLFALINPLPFMGEHLTVYHRLVAPRVRLPYGEHPDSYNLSLDNLDAMFASHAIAQPKASDEFRLLVMGDSGIWGILLQPQETLTEQLNAKNLTTSDGRRIVAYNIAHPILSATKDLMLMDYAMRYNPDGVLWLVTLDSLYQPDQLRPPLAHNNPDRIHHLIETYGLNLDTQPLTPQPTFFEKTIVGQRRALADGWRLQMFGFMWQNTGIDQLYNPYTPTANDLSDSTAWQHLDEGDPLADALALDVLGAGQTLAGDLPFWVVNEPIMIADGANGDIRYNAWYPRWAYDEYRALLSLSLGAIWMDFWDVIPRQHFTDSPVHLSGEGMGQFAEILAQVIQDRLQ
jgi:uncharacterized protein YukJ